MSINDQQWELVRSMYWNLMLPIHFSSLRICKKTSWNHNKTNPESSRAHLDVTCMLILLGWIWALDVISAITYMNEAPKKPSWNRCCVRFLSFKFHPKEFLKGGRGTNKPKHRLVGFFFSSIWTEKTCHVYLISNTWHEHRNLYHNLTYEYLQLVCHKETSDYLMATSHFNKIPQPSGLLYRKKIAQIAHPGGPAKRSTCHVRKFVLKVDWHQLSRKCM